MASPLLRHHRILIRTTLLVSDRTLGWASTSTSTTCPGNEGRKRSKTFSQTMQSFPMQTARWVGPSSLRMPLRAAPRTVWASSTRHPSTGKAGIHVASHAQKLDAVSIDESTVLDSIVRPKAVIIATGRDTEKGQMAPLPFNRRIAHLLVECLHSFDASSDPRQTLLRLMNLMRKKARLTGTPLDARQFMNMHDCLCKDADELVERFKSSGMALDAALIPACEPSMPSFVLLLKLAARQNKLKLIRLLGKKAFNWHKFDIRSNGKEVSLAEKTAQIQQEQTELQVLIRNLTISTKIRLGQDPFDPERSIKVAPGPSMQNDVQDIYALRALFRERVGALSTYGSQHGRQSLKRLRISRLVSASRYPLSHRGRRIKRINVLAHRNSLFLHGRHANDVSQTNKGDSLALYQPSRLTKRLLEEEIPTREVGASSDGEDAESGSRAFLRTSEYRDVLRSWRNLVENRVARRRRVMQLLSQHYKDAQQMQPSLGSQRIFPTWFLLDRLRIAVEAGSPKLTAQLVSQYLQHLRSVQNVSNNEAIKGMKYDGRTEAVSRPLEPPNSPVLLNAILRAHMTNGATDAWLHMLNVIDKWCCGGDGLANTIRRDCGLPSVEEAFKTTGLPASFAEVQEGRCLYPNETTVLLLLDALPSTFRKTLTRRKQGSGQERLQRGRAIVVEFCKRWAPRRLQFDSEDSQSGSRDTGRQDTALSHQRPLRFTMRTFRVLLRRATLAESSSEVRSVLELHTQWMKALKRHVLLSQWFDASSADGEHDKVKKRRATLSEPDQKSFDRVVFDDDVRTAYRERMLWINALLKAAKNRVISPDEALQHFVRWDFVSSARSRSDFSRQQQKKTQSA